MTKFKMADLWALLTFISPCERNKCVSFFSRVSLYLVYMVVMTSPWTSSKMVTTKFKMADLLAILTFILPCERDNCGSFRRILLKFCIHDGNDQPLDKFKNGRSTKLLAILTLILPCERNKCGIFFRISLYLAYMVVMSSPWKSSKMVTSKWPTYWLF